MRQGHQHAVTVHFIGAGPGAPDLITVRGLDFIRRAPVVLYAGSLGRSSGQGRTGERPRHRHRAADAGGDRRRDDGSACRRSGVARVHSGDPSLYGAIAEQMRRLDALFHSL